MNPLAQKAPLLGARSKSSCSPVGRCLFFARTLWFPLVFLFRCARNVPWVLPLLFLFLVLGSRGFASRCCSKLTPTNTPVLKPATYGQAMPVIQPPETLFLLQLFGKYESSELCGAAKLNAMASLSPCGQLACNTAPTTSFPTSRRSLRYDSVIHSMSTHPTNIIRFST